MKTASQSHHSHDTKQANGHPSDMKNIYASKDPKLLFRRLHKRTLAIGLDPKHFHQLNSLQDLQSNTLSIVIQYLLGTALLLTTLTITSVFFSFPFSDTWIITTITQFKDVENEQCVVENLDILQDLFQAPIDCGTCRGIQEVDQVSSLSPQEFERKYAYTGRPVVITDAMTNWTAPMNFTFDFFREIYTTDSTKSRQNCQFFPYKTSFTSLHDVFNMSDDRAKMVPGFKPWYVGWSNCDPVVANNLRRHYSRPYFLPPQSESSKTDWIFIGTPGFGAHLHLDNVHNPSWQAQVRGRKIWILEPPPECYDVCHPHIEVTLVPGNIIVIDTNRWYHATKVIGDDLSICIGSEYD